VDFDQAADELFGLPPEAFVAERGRLAKAARSAGDRDLAAQITALRRPTVPAWILNLLTREAPDLLDAVLAAGTDLREAWTTGGDLAAADRQRNRAVGAALRKADDLAGHLDRPLTTTARREIEDTLLAAVVDASVAEEVRAGRLSQPRSHIGFGDVTPPPPPPAEAPPAEDPRLRLRREETAAAEARKAAESAAKTLAAAESDLASAQRETDRLDRELKELNDLREAAEERLRAVQQDRDQAAQQAAHAQDQAEQAQRRLEETRKLS
jgi:hypothetical protein